MMVVFINHSGLIEIYLLKGLYHEILKKYVGVVKLESSIVALQIFYSNWDSTDE